MMSWVSLVSSIRILCFENIGSGLPGSTFLAVYARTKAHTHTYKHAQIRTHKFAHTIPRTCMATYIYTQTKTHCRARVCVQEIVCVYVREWVCEGVRVAVCVKVSVCSPWGLSFSGHCTGKIRSDAYTGFKTWYEGQHGKACFGVHRCEN